jgi:hypothetical protein
MARVSAALAQAIAEYDYEGVGDDPRPRGTRRRYRVSGVAPGELSRRLVDPAFRAAEARRSYLAERVFEIFGTLPRLP